MTVLDSYIAELGASLRGARRPKQELLQEARDHLVDAAEVYETTGLSRVDAERNAVRDFGDVATLAPAYQAMLSVEHGRRLGIGLFWTMAVQPFAWGFWTSSTSADRSGRVFTALNDYVELAGLVAWIVATLAVIGCGVAVRYVGVRRRLLRLALAGAIASSAVIVVVSATMYLLSGPTLVGAAFIAAVAWIPLGAIMVGGAQAFGALDEAGGLGRPLGRPQHGLDHL